jgi:hypothetical protein
MGGEETALHAHLAVRARHNRLGADIALVINNFSSGN